MGNSCRSPNNFLLSEEELDRRCEPSGLYANCERNTKTIRRRIAKGKLAARLVGSSTRILSTYQECPICFMHYKEVNTTMCCEAVLCTECYLQIKPANKDAPCPFCNSPKLSVKLALKMTCNQINTRDTDEQITIEAKIRVMLKSKSCDESDSNILSEAAHLDDGSTEASAFGTCLERDIQNRKRSLSCHESEEIIVASIEHRKNLEEKMKRQRHPFSCTDLMECTNSESRPHLIAAAGTARRNNTDNRLLEQALALSIEECTRVPDIVLRPLRYSSNLHDESNNSEDYRNLNLLSEEDQILTAISRSLHDLTHVTNLDEEHSEA